MSGRRGLVLLLFTLAPRPVAGQEVKHPKLVAKIDSVANQAIANGPIPGLSIAVARGKETILARGYGYASLADSTPASAETVYPIASITKQFTAAAIMQLAEQGRLDVRDELAKYLPDFPTQGYKVTIQQLLNHTSGIPNETGPDSAGHRHSALEFSPGEFVSLFGPLPRDFAPGTRFAYSNSGYYLLGLVVEKIAGSPYGEYVRGHLFQRAQMDASSDCETVPAHAVGYDRPDSTLVRAPAITGGRLFAAAGLCSTVLDLLKWQRALVDRKVVNGFYWNQMIEPAELKDGSRASYGYGTMLGRLQKHRFVGHGGSVEGFSSQLSFYPDDDVTVVVLANSERALTRRITDQVAGFVLGVIEPKVKDLPLATADLERYTGTFDLAGEPLEVYVASGKLMIRLGRADGLHLLYQGANEFVAEPDPATKVYFLLRQGRARRLMFSAGDLTLNADRK